jgi:hypothetical protein
VLDIGLESRGRDVVPVDGHKAASTSAHEAFDPLIAVATHSIVQSAAELPYWVQRVEKV